MSDPDESLVEREPPKRAMFGLIVIVVVIFGFVVAALLAVDLTNDSDDDNLVPVGTTVP